MTRRRTSGGYVAIVSIVLVTILIGIWLYYYSPLAASKTSLDETDSVGIEAIRAAKNAKTLLERH